MLFQTRSVVQRLGISDFVYDQLNDVKEYVVQHFDISAVTRSCTTEIADKLRSDPPDKTCTDTIDEYPIVDILESIDDPTALLLELSPDSVGIMPIYLPLEPVLLSTASPFITSTKTPAMTSSTASTAAPNEKSAFSGKRSCADSSATPPAKRVCMSTRTSSLSTLTNSALVRPISSGTPAENLAARRRWNQQQKRERNKLNQKPTHVRLRKHLNKLQPDKEISDFNPRRLDALELSLGVDALAFEKLSVSDLAFYAEDDLATASTIWTSALYRDPLVTDPRALTREGLPAMGFRYIKWDGM